MRIVVLIENTSAAERLKAEHGLCLYVENAGERYLIDAGASDRFFTNAARLRIDPATVGKVALSHNRSDHTGGLETLIRKKPDVQIYARAAGNAEYFMKYGMIRVSVGQLADLYEEYTDNFVLYNNFQRIGEGFYAMANEIPDYTMYAEEKRLYRKSGARLVRDDYSHEAFFVLFPEGRRESGCVVISACSHCGIVNVLKTVKLRFPGTPILAVVGGFHMMGGSEKKLCCSTEYIDKTVNELKAIETGVLYTCHCTGLAAYGIMKPLLGDRLQYLQTGEELEF
ncbi:MAG: MBL fold metallo-hydrolase [Bacteroides sp.]|nr:MBL fold metallo-hydrolase [Eubacterium sp.]MCM1417748.1 MBL fold metallo-hydrolase [Roseburia sp.]MCM1461361.1 MBL fold metallo-hydrolase [Bacteroides sp.]